jgi:hypothetical protein
MKLFILGNGFDLHHNLPTTTADFIRQIEALDVTEYYLQSGTNWSLYEEGLSYFNVEDMAECNIEGPDYLSDRESDRDSVIFQMEQIMDDMIEIRDNALKEMITIANDEISINSDCVKNYGAFIDSLVLSFNYTSTLEELYNLNDIESILHIHGYFEDHDELIFGYSKPNEDVLKQFSPHDVFNNSTKHPSHEIDVEDHDDYYIQMQYQSMYNFYCNNQKTLQINILKNWLEPYYGQVEEIIVLGHSMGLVDKPYFELLEELLNPVRWQLSQYENTPSKEDMLDYSFHTKVDFCNITDFVPVI